MNSLTKNVSLNPSITARCARVQCAQLSGVASPCLARHDPHPSGPGGKPGAHGSDVRISHVMKLLTEFKIRVGVDVCLSACCEKKHNRASNKFGSVLQPDGSWAVEFMPSTTSKKRSRMTLWFVNTLGVSRKNPASAMHRVCADGGMLAAT